MVITREKRGCGKHTIQYTDDVFKKRQREREESLHLICNLKYAIDPLCQWILNMACDILLMIMKSITDIREKDIFYLFGGYSAL